MSSIYKQIISFIILIVIIPILFIPILSKDIQINKESFDTSLHSIFINKNPNSKFIWPSPGYTKINSYFGKRSSPTRYASSFHQGIDIGAPQGANLVAVTDSIVTYIGFNGSAGYSIHLKSGILEFYYHHVNPNYIIHNGQMVYAGQIIGNVGPKNVYGIKNNPYKDSLRKSYKWSNNWSSFTFHNKKRRQSRQSFKIFLKFTYHLLHILLHHYNHDDSHGNYVHIHDLRSNLILLYCYILGIQLFLSFYQNLLLKILHHNKDK